MTLAHKQGLPLQRCMEENTSTEFVDWQVFYEEQQRQELKVHDKQDHYMAQIALKIHQVIEVLCEVPVGKRKVLKDMLLEFNPGVPVEEDGSEYKLVRVDGQPRHDPYKPLPRDEHGNLIGGIDTDDPGPLPERWQKVNRDAKLAIGLMLGVPDVFAGEIGGGDGSPGT